MNKRIKYIFYTTYFIYPILLKEEKILQSKLLKFLSELVHS